MSTTKSCPQCGATYGADQRFCAHDGAALRGEASNGSLVGEVLADRYLVQEQLGEGGMGQVYRAEHVRMRRPCAVKVLRPAVAADPDAVSRFNREAANASRVAHPNVAAVYDFGETADGDLPRDGARRRAPAARALDDGALPPAARGRSWLRSPPGLRCRALRWDRASRPEAGQVMLAARPTARTS